MGTAFTVNPDSARAPRKWGTLAEIILVLSLVAMATLSIASSITSTDEAPFETSTAQDR
jgi:hypothetical protein